MSDAAARDIVRRRRCWARCSPWCLFDPGRMGLARIVNARPRGYPSERVAQWHAARGEAAAVD